MTNNLIKRYSVFTHGLLEKQAFSFHLYYFSFYLSFRLVRKLVFLFFNVNVYLMEIPCLNKVTIPYHTIPFQPCEIPCIPKTIHDTQSEGRYQGHQAVYILLLAALIFQIKKHVALQDNTNDDVQCQDQAQV